MLKEIAMHTGQNQESAINTMNCYVGNVHVSPTTRLLNTFNSDSVYSQPTPELNRSKSYRSVLMHKKEKKAFKQQDFILDYIKLSQMKEDINVAAEEKIAKHALLEAMFETQLWMEPYIVNPFIYITDHDSDFKGPEGVKLKEYFKKVFLSQYTKYRKIVQENTPEEYYI